MKVVAIENMLNTVGLPQHEIAALLLLFAHYAPVRKFVDHDFLPESEILIALVAECIGRKDPSLTLRDNITKLTVAYLAASCPSGEWRPKQESLSSFLTKYPDADVRCVRHQTHSPIDIFDNYCARLATRKETEKVA